jgi:NitT/TauT family transport system permease protein
LYQFFFYLILLAADVAKQTEKELMETAYTLGAKDRQVLLRVVMPAALPGIWDALRVMMGVGWTMIIVAEMVSSDNGIGAMIIHAQRFLQTPRIFVGIIAIGLIGILLDAIFKITYHLMFPWANK